MIIRSYTGNLFLHLAAEDLLLERAATQEPCLLLWVGGPAVVLGKNQLAWRECRPSRLTDRNGRLARRQSGGGAVYHDEGNLNYSFFVPRSDYRPESLYQLVIDSIKPLGPNLVRHNGHTLTLDGRKCSGHAFRFSRGGVLHHGTLLVSANLDALRACLEPCAGTIRTRAVSSIPAPVVNLASAFPGLSVGDAARAIADGFCSYFGGAQREVRWEDLDQREIQSRAARLASDEWIIDCSPDAEVILREGDLPAGNALCGLVLSVRGGRMDRLCATPEMPDVSRVLRGCRLDSRTVRRRLEDAGLPLAVAEALQAAGY